MQAYSHLYRKAPREIRAAGTHIYTRLQFIGYASGKIVAQYGSPAAVRQQLAGKNVEQCRFTRPVSTQQPENLAFLNRKRDAAQRVILPAPQETGPINFMQ